MSNSVEVPSIDICTWNVGNGGIEDFAHPRKFADPSYFPKRQLTEPEQKRFEAQRSEADQKCAEAVASFQSDVYCLQKVSRENRPIIESLKTRDYTIINPANDYRSVLAISRYRFEDIQNHSKVINLKGHCPGIQIDNVGVAIATAIDKQTSQKVAFLSALIPENSSQFEEGLCCNVMADQLLPLECDLQVIGGDINADLRNIPKSIFNQRGYKAVGVGDEEYTSVKSDGQVALRAVDHIFIKDSSAEPRVERSLWQRIKDYFSSFFANKIETDRIRRPLGGLRYEDWCETPVVTSSDHKPVYAKINTTKTYSKFWQLLQRMCSCFSRTRAQTNVV